MTGSSLTDIVHRLPILLGAEALGSLTDSQLVERFAANRDEAAFALLVERHGPLVLGVSRQVLHNRHEAEDVFQAAFLMLARKANTLRAGQAVRAWLYQTTVNLSRTIRTAAARRQNHERQAARDAMSDSSSSVSLPDFQSALHEEVSRLPEKFRLPVLMCHLDGKTHDEAAGVLGCPVGTVRSRLSRARDLLRRRLERRGVTMASLAMGTISGSSVNAVPFPLAVATVHSAVAFAAGPASAPDAASANAWALAEGALRHGAVRLKLLTATVLVFGLASVGMVWAQTQREEERLSETELAHGPAVAILQMEDQTPGKHPTRQTTVKDEEIEVTPMMNGRYIPPPEYINMSQPVVLCRLNTKWTVEEGQLCAYLQLFVGVASNAMDDEIHKKQRFVVYQPSAGFSVIALGGSVRRFIRQRNPFSGISPQVVLVAWRDSDDPRPLSEQLTESMTNSRHAVLPDYILHPEFKWKLEEYRSSSYPSVLVTGDPNATEEEKKLSVHVTFNPIRIIVRGPAASLSE
jgi:RNA polymerase sigma factor (sigma-70 family)